MQKIIMKQHRATIIIEDNPGDLLLLESQLETAGWPVGNNLRQYSLSDAVECLKTIKPVVVFLDLNLPDSNGLETFLTIQAIAPDIPIIILSGIGDIQLSVQAVQAGAQDFLVKGEFGEKLLLKTILYSIERKKNQLKIEEINKRYNYASAATNEPLWDWDIKSNEILWNDKVKIFGYDDAVTKNKTWRLNNIHLEDKETVSKALKEILLQGQGSDQWDQYYRFRCADGSYKHIHDRGYIIKDKSRQPCRMIGTMQDITERVVLQEKLAEEKENQQKAILRTSIETQEKERNEIGKELHDNVNQILATVNMHLGMAKQGNEKRTLELVKESRNLLKKAVDEIRNISHSIVSTHILDLGLVRVIEEFIHNIKQAGTLEIYFINTLTDDKIISSSVALTLFRIIQEQVHNIIKHASARTAYIKIKATSDTIVLCIIDDGKGVNINSITKGIGLSNIRNRVTTYNGKVEFMSKLDEGFKVTVYLPLKEG
jgi:two-component system, NarL family, sensor histidine kinase UhpB